MRCFDFLFSAKPLPPSNDLPNRHAEVPESLFSCSYSTRKIILHQLLTTGVPLRSA